MGDKASIVEEGTGSHTRSATTTLIMTMTSTIMTQTTTTKPAMTSTMTTKSFNSFVVSLLCVLIRLDGLVGLPIGYFFFEAALN